ncbi:MAG: ring-cleaving dioxygenase [Armatimonadota bacterium]|nr:ring-cleaving dioxygenase [Armatimonadota bacterium]MDR7549682.1 ring-cleaving dioxygenase [Armatimonadota bacterium]
MTPQIPGIHHVTAIAGDPQRNVDFYVGTLGLRLVKRTVNFDDPGTYHLYYGDEVGRPGTLVTFFAWPGAPRGRIGVGQVTATAFSIPARAVGFWQERLRRHGIAVRGPTARFDDAVLAFEDPDGLPLELVASDDDARTGRGGGPIPEAYTIRGVHGVTLSERGLDEGGRRTLGLLDEGLGFRLVGEVGRRFRFAAGDGGTGALVDVLCLDGAPTGETAAGTVHHIAWRTPDDAHQRAWQERIARLGLRVTDVRDRQYFRSIYFREPGGVLFEIATDPPGFTVDEPPAHLGTHLMLPPWLEPRRAQVERALPPLSIPEVRMS